MLLYFYIFLLCVHWTFSYNDIRDDGRNAYRSRRVKKYRNKEKKNVIREAYDYDKAPVQFDLASFIQADDETTENDDAYRYRNEKRQRIAKNYDYDIMNLKKNDDIYTKSFNVDKEDHFQELNLNPSMYKEPANNKFLTLNSLDEMNAQNNFDKRKNTLKSLNTGNQVAIVHSQNKKSAFKRLKFPFFSRNNTEAVKSKTKKRKLFCFTCPKKADNTSMPANSRVEEESTIHFKVRKRSIEERLCPICKKRFIAVIKTNERKKKNPIIHNSRQFFQRNSEMQSDAVLKGLEKLKFKDQERVFEKRRRKRDESERERQLKELETVESKINKVQIVPPKSNKPEQQ